MTVLESILSVVRARREGRENVIVDNYASLVVATADERKVDPAQVDQLMAQAGRNESQFRADVERVRTRRELVSRARSLPKLRGERIAATLANLEASQRLPERLQQLRNEAAALSARAHELNEAEEAAESALRVVLAAAPAELVAAYEHARAARVQAEDDKSECERMALGEYSATGQFHFAAPRCARLLSAWRELSGARDFLSDAPPAAVAGAKAACETRKAELIAAAKAGAKKLEAELVRLRAAEVDALEAVLATEDAVAARLALGKVVR